MRRIVRFASTVLSSLSLALIVLAAISGGEARAGLLYCGYWIGTTTQSNSGGGVTVITVNECSSASSCYIAANCSYDTTMYPFGPGDVPNGSTCWCYNFTTP